MRDVIKETTISEMMFNTLVDKWDGDKSVDKAIAILHQNGYETSSIALHVNEVHSKVIKWLAKIIM